MDISLCLFFLPSVLSDVTVKTPINVFWSTGAEISLLNIY